ncbi:MAG TPA: hypothetical protein VFL12_05045, partial [Thermoanaerobaculia bacterium]|nr:hypothetical protein [Thermoanaerobaculia bacterium]
MSTAEKTRPVRAAGLVARFTAFAIEQFPASFEALRSAFDAVVRPAGAADSPEALEALRTPLA